MRNRQILLGLVVILGLLPASVLAGHFSGMSSVDEKEIRWDSSTSYTDARDWAHNQWGRLGAITVAPDVWYTYADLEWKDIDVENLRWLAFWAHLPGTDQINMNAYYLSSASDFERRMAAAHEFGHALGIDDHYSSAYSDQLMYYEASSVNTPQSHDVDDYNTLWK